jgi:DNA-binding SARP family transcriptional activator
MRYLVLGPLELRNGTDPVALPQGRQRLLLAVLLLNANQVLSSDRLIEELWGESPPPTANRSLHNMVSALRKQLPPDTLLTRGHGYRLQVGADELDAERFEQLARSGRAALDAGDPQRASEQLGDALALWRGSPLTDLAYEPAVQQAVGRLEERRLAVLEDRIEADLARGRHTEILPELDALVAEHPLRERLVGARMLALYRSGRQADALAGYRDLRERLDVELGLQPGPALQRLDPGVLEHDAELGVPDRLPRAPQRARRRLPLIAIGGAALVSVAVAAALLRHDDSGPEASAATTGSVVAAIDPATNRVADRFPVGSTPVAITAGAGAAWTVNADDQTISKIDARTKRVRTFGTDTIPLDVAAGERALWVVGGERTEVVAPPATLTGIDDATGDALVRTSIPPTSGQTVRGPPSSVAAAGGGVWAIGRTGWLRGLDVATGRTRTLRRADVYSIAGGDGQVWALAGNAPGKPGAKLLRIDPRTGRVITTFDMPAYGGPLAVGAGAVWMVDAFAGAVWRVDPTARLIRPFTVGQGIDSIAAGAGAVWVGNSVAGTVSRFDAATNRVTQRFVVGGTPRAIAFGSNRVWVAIAGDAAAVPSGGSLSPDANVKPVDQPGCGPVLTGPGGRPDLLIVTDLPGRGGFTATTQPMAAAIAFAVRTHGFRAGRFSVAVQGCDDSLAVSGAPDVTKCASNAKAYVRNTSVIGVVGPLQSYCSFAMLPILNRARGGPVSLVSPTNTVVDLVRRAPGMAPDALRQLYPTGRRGYARVATADDQVMAGVARVADRLGDGRVVYLADRFEAAGQWPLFFRREARRIGLKIVDFAAWEPERRSYRALARRVRDSGAGAVVVDGQSVTSQGQVLKDLRAVLGPDYPIVGTEPMLSIAQLFEDAGDAARGVHIVFGGLSTSRLDATGRRFVRQFGATRPGGRVHWFDVFSAAAAEALLDAIARSDGTRESVAQALKTTRLDASPIGPFALDRRGEIHPANVTVVGGGEGGGAGRTPRPGGGGGGGGVTK